MALYVVRGWGFETISHEDLGHGCFAHIFSPAVSACETSSASCASMNSMRASIALIVSIRSMRGGPAAAEAKGLVRILGRNRGA